MRTPVVVGLGVASILMLALVPETGLLPVEAQLAQAPHIGEGGLPQFERDPAWPKVPTRWRMGAGSAVTSDAQGHVWVLTRPRSLASTPGGDAATAPAPPVMEFDQAGTFVQAWGGESGSGYQWPSNEHGMTVDSRGFIWVVGNADGNQNGLPNDNQVLKFTRTGTFVMAIGTSGRTGSNKTDVLRGATSMFYYAKTNELFVSDGYGNSRVIVFDAETGAMKRMWGAYGDTPLDADDRPARPAPSVEPWFAVAEALQQFGSPVHDVKVSDDGLVYVCDRGNKRVQVFTTEGRFVAEQFVGLDSRYPYQSRGVAFSPDQRFLYVGGTPVIYILNRRTLEVLGSFRIGDGRQLNPPGHQIGADNKGNLYIVQAAVGGAGAQKFTFKGYSPSQKCCQGGGVRAAS
jgi:hypothetical protein